MHAPAQKRAAPALPRRHALALAPRRVTFCTLRAAHYAPRRLTAPSAAHGEAKKWRTPRSSSARCAWQHISNIASSGGISTCLTHHSAACSGGKSKTPLRACVRADKTNTIMLFSGATFLPQHGFGWDGIFLCASLFCAFITLFGCLCAGSGNSIGASARGGARRIAVSFGKRRGALEERKLDGRLSDGVRSYRGNVLPWRDGATLRANACGWKKGVGGRGLPGGISAGATIAVSERERMTLAAYLIA